MPLSVKDGMGAWIKDFQKSDAPQFKGKSDKERREMAMAAYLSAKRGEKNEGYVSDAQRRAVHATKADGGKGHPDNKKEEVKPPFDPDPKKPQAKNSDGTKTSPMSRARQLARMARDRNMKKEDTQLDELSNDTLRSYHAKAATDLKKKKDQVSKGQLTQKDFKKGQNRVTGLNRAANKMESVELEEMYASTTEPHKDGHRPKVVRTQPNGKTTMSYLGQHVYKSKEHARNAADHIANGMRKGRASDSYIQDFARRHHKEHGMKESVEENFNWKVSHAGKDVHVKAPHAGAAVKKAQKGFGNMDLTKAKISNLGKVGAPTKEETQIDELDTKTYSSYSDKAGKQLMGRDLSPDKRSLRALGRATADMKKYGDKRTLRQRIRQDMNKESVELDESVAKAYEIMKPTKSMNHGIEAIKKTMKVDHGTATRLAKQVMDKVKKGEFKESIGEAKLDELSPATHKSYQAKAFKSGAAGMAAKRMGTMSAKDAYDNEKKRHAGIELSKSLQRRDDRKKRNEEVEEAKSADQKFTDHLKFATSKSSSVQNYLAKRKADRDAMNKKNDPNAAKKGYALTAVPPERAFKKAQKKGMSASDASQAVGTASRNRGRKLPK